MSNIRFDWRWIVLIVIVAIVANGSALPWPVLVLALGGGGGYLLYMGWQVWSGGSISTPRVTYWRGQRIEVRPQRRASLPSLRTIGPALLYLIIGSALLLASLAVVLRQFGN